MKDRIKLTGTVSSNEAVYGEILTYTLNVKNISEEYVEDITLKNILESDLTFVKNSVRINKVLMRDENIISGVNIDLLEPEAEVVINFDFRVDAEKSRKITTISEADFYYNEGNKRIRDFIVSNDVEIITKILDLYVSVETDKEEVSLNESINYTITIENRGEVSIKNIVFKDKLSKEVCIVNNSININHRGVNGVNLEQGIFIGNLDRDEKKIITYVAKVNYGNDCKIKNEIKVNYDYMLSNGFIYSKELDFESKEIRLRMTNFKQMSIDNYFEIPKHNEDVYEIHNVKVDINIKNKHLIETAKMISSEGQILSGKSLVVHGEILQNIEYTAYDCGQKIFTASYSIPFSTFIVLPKGFYEGNIYVETVIENVSYKVLGPRMFYENILFLIIAKTREA